MLSYAASNVVEYNKLKASLEETSNQLTMTQGLVKQKNEQIKALIASSERQNSTSEDHLSLIVYRLNPQIK